MNVNQRLRTGPEVSISHCNLDWRNHLQKKNSREHQVNSAQKESKLNGQASLPSRLLESKAEEGKREEGGSEEKGFSNTKPQVAGPSDVESNRRCQASQRLCDVHDNPLVASHKYIPGPRHPETESTAIRRPEPCLNAGHCDGTPIVCWTFEA